MTTEVLSEAARLRRVPRIVFADGPTGRRARLAGTGIKVFEVISHVRAMGDDWAASRAWHDMLSDAEFAAARAYYAAFPAEIDAWLAEAARFEAWLSHHAPLLPSARRYPEEPCR